MRLRPHDATAKEALASLYISPDFPRRQRRRGAARRARRSCSSSSPTSARRAATSRGRSRSCGARSAPIRITSRRRRGSSAPTSTASGADELRRFYRQGAPVPRRALKLAELAIDAGDADEAVAALRRGARRRRRHRARRRAARGAADGAEEVGADRRAARAARSAIWQGRDRADLLVDVATHWQRAANGERFESSLLEALAADPVHPDAYQLLAEHLTQKRDYATLVGIAEQAVEAAPLGRSAAAAGRAGRSLREEARRHRHGRPTPGGAPRRSRRRPRAASELKRLMQKQERWASMTASLERELEAARDKDTRVEVLKRLGQVYRERHDLPSARGSCGTTRSSSSRRTRRSIARSPSCRSARATRQRWPRRCASSCARPRRRSRSSTCLRKLAVLYDERLHDLEGVEWACTRDPRAAARRSRCAAPARGGVRARRRGGRAAAHRGPRAARAARRRRRRRRVPLLHRLAALYDKRGDAAAAAERLERIVKLDKNDHKALEALARLDAALEKWPEAAVALERTLPQGAGRGPRASSRGSASPASSTASSTTPCARRAPGRKCSSGGRPTRRRSRG